MTRATSDMGSPPPPASDLRGLTVAQAESMGFTVKKKWTIKRPYLVALVYGPGDGWIAVLVEGHTRNPSKKMTLPSGKTIPPHRRFGNADEIRRLVMVPEGAGGLTDDTFLWFYHLRVREIELARVADVYHWGTIPECHRPPIYRAMRAFSPRRYARALDRQLPDEPYANN